VVDIGGGSTEFIVGQRFEPIRLESLQLGCVSYAQRFFPAGELSKNNYNAAYDQALVEVSHIRSQYHSGQWAEAVGSSGTLQAIETLVQMEGWRETGIDRKALDKLRKRLLKFDHADAIDLPGLSDKRRQVIAAGVAITSAIFDGLNIDVMRTSNGALREGVIYDLLGRLSHEDVRERSINAMVARYHANETYARVVGERVSWLARSVAGPWGFTERDIELLTWAGRCHEIGTAISQKHFNRHSAYLLQNTDLPGFSQGEQEVMATLVRGQRGKIRPELFEMIPESQRQKLSRLMVLLRLAVILKWVEALETLPDCSVSATGDTLELTLPSDWRTAHPLTDWELRQGKNGVAKLGIRLELG